MTKMDPYHYDEADYDGVNIGKVLYHTDSYYIYHTAPTVLLFFFFGLLPLLC